MIIGEKEGSRHHFVQREYQCITFCMVSSNSFVHRDEADTTILRKILTSSSSSGGIHGQSHPHWEVTVGSEVGREHFNEFAISKDGSTHV